MKDLKVDEKTMEKAEEVIDQFRQEYFKAAFTPVKNIYIDIEVLQDFRLGALLCLITTETEMSYIKHVLSKPKSPYQVRVNDDTMAYFPAIKSITNKDIDEYIADPSNHKVLVKISPMTSVYNELGDIITSIADKNAGINREDPGATIHIGTNSVKYDNEDYVNLARAIVAFDPRFQVEMYNKPLYAVGRRLTTYELLLINDIEEFAGNQHYSYVFDEDVPLFDATIMGFPKLTVQVDSPEEGMELIANTELCFNTYTNFHYIPRGVGV